MNQNYINHVCFLLDRSGSMSGLKRKVVEVFDAQIKNLAKRSQELNQETRVSVFVFGDDAQCVIYDKDVLRLPSIEDFYQIKGNTALIDATILAINDLNMTPQKYGDHAFLFYVLTDGENNINNSRADALKQLISKLPDNFTVAVMVPNQFGIHECKKFGFPAGNIAVWDTTEKGMEKAGDTMTSTTDSFMRSRSSGVRGYKNLFDLDASNLNKSVVVNNLDELSPKDYILLNVHKDAVIKDFIESWKVDFRQGANYYQITKPETIQSYKQIVLQNKRNGKVFAGVKARQILGLPSYDVKVNPASYGEFDLFCQSTSTNRKLIGGTKLIILK
jgi:hypothetical protein